MTKREFQFRYEYNYQNGVWYHTAWAPLAVTSVKQARAWLARLEEHPTVKYRNVQVRRRTVAVSEWKDIQWT